MSNATEGVLPPTFLYHFHGLGSLDFSSMDPAQLPDLEYMASMRQLEILPTIYLRREGLSAFAELVREYGMLSQRGLLPSIAGFSLEGPLLGPEGGIPVAASWFPNLDEWQRLARLGSQGLRYIVLAPDAVELDDEIAPGFEFSDLVDALYENGVRIAMGHFHRDDPWRSSERMKKLIDYLHGKYESSPYLILTDHLYNDMPRDFLHTWRGEHDAQARLRELSRLTSVDWSPANLFQLLGPVPASLLLAAKDDLIMPCLNFDGVHVDLEVCKLTVGFLGADKLIALTDHTEVPSMAFEPLHLDLSEKLWLRSDGKVAAGTQGPSEQRLNMQKIGINAGDVQTMFFENARAAISYKVRTKGPSVRAQSS